MGFRVCSKCKVEKPLEEFYARKGRNGVSRCKTCYREDQKSSEHKLAVKKWQQANPDKTKASSSRWHSNNPEIVKRIRRTSYLNNLEHQKACARLWIKNNPEQAKATRKDYLVANPTLLRNSLEGLRASILLRDLILQRDGFKCQLCPSSTALVVHHIIPKTRDVNLVMRCSNLVTLCKTCHKNKAHAGCFRNLDIEIATQLTVIVEQKKFKEPLNV
jgi:hypothetical protein